MTEKNSTLSHVTNGKEVHIVTTTIKEHIVAVACTNANGDADIVVVITRVNEDQRENSEHYEQAIAILEEDDYSGPFVCFDENEQKNIHRVINELAK
jgi:hypothetical protein